jgi:Domain of unknown function (DUF4129)
VAQLSAERLPLLAARLPVPERDPAQVRQTVREVLSRPEYQTQPPTPVDRVVEWLLDRLADVLAGLTGSGPGSLVGLVLFVVILAGVGVLIVRFARGLTRDPELAAAMPAVPLRPPADWLAEAARREAAGDWRGGLRCRYRALVAGLGARGLLDEVPGTTAGEYRLQVAGNAPAVAGEFAGATELFELAWYGNRATGARESARFRELAERVMAGAAATRAPAAVVDRFRSGA